MTFTASIKAMCPVDNRMKEYLQVIDLPCETVDEANQHVQDNFMGYMKIEAVCEIQNS